MHPALHKTEHRPWPLPEKHWRWRQKWMDLAFLHYPVDPGALRERLPKGLELDTHNGTAWVGLVPFRMDDVGWRQCPALPFGSSFPELNLRTYVKAGGKAGVWFFSLDADSWAFVLGGRMLYRLPYHKARMRLQCNAGTFEMTSLRQRGGVRFKASYRPVGEVFHAREGSFEHWATERYCLYAPGGDRVVTRVEVHHPPWPLQRAEVHLTESDILEAAGFPPLQTTPVCHFSPGVEVVSFPTERVAVL